MLLQIRRLLGTQKSTFWLLFIIGRSLYHPVINLSGIGQLLLANLCGINEPHRIIIKNIYILCIWRGTLILVINQVNNREKFCTE